MLNEPSFQNMRITLKLFQLLTRVRVKRDNPLLLAMRYYIIILYRFVHVYERKSLQNRLKRPLVYLSLVQVFVHFDDSLTEVILSLTKYTQDQKNYRFLNCIQKYKYKKILVNPPLIFRHNPGP